MKDRRRETDEQRGIEREKKIDARAGDVGPRELSGESKEGMRGWPRERGLGWSGQKAGCSACSEREGREGKAKCKAKGVRTRVGP